jgi:hypothetical protein
MPGPREHTIFVPSDCLKGPIPAVTEPSKKNNDLLDNEYWIAPRLVCNQSVALMRRYVHEMVDECARRKEPP